LGDLYDDFAFTAGLRRYYWDVYASSDGKLTANNYYTADASKVYGQAALAAAQTAVQSAFNSIEAINLAHENAKIGEISVTTSFRGDSLEVETGSHADLDTWTAALTVSGKIGHDFGETTLGLLTEFGSSSYDTTADVFRYGEVLGDGDVELWSGGIFMKTLFNQNTFVEASVRAGGIQNEFKLNKDPWIARPEVHSFDSTTSYYGAHLGLGQRFEISDKTLLEAYGRLLWTRAAGDDFTTGFGDQVNLEDIDSLRTRVGARLNFNLRDDSLKIYVGAAEEHEFKGEAKGRLGLDAFTAPELKGDSGYGELGLSFKPGSENFTMSLGAFGYAGRQKGGGGTASLTFNF
jgi:outer membrane autotransporter protein